MLPYREHTPPFSPTVCALLLGCIALHGCHPASAHPEMGHSTAAIIAGSPSTSDDAVVALWRAGELLCSGTLIAQRVVLTAAHCFPLVPVDVPAHSVRIVSADGSRRIPLTAVVIHPDYQRRTYAADLALVLLAHPVAQTPAALNQDPLDETWLGRQIRLVGFGLTAPQGKSGTRRQLATPLTGIDENRFKYGEATCNGDSGGPAFAQVHGQERLIGVTASGPADCRHYGRSTRVDAYLEWITTTQHDLEFAGGCDVVGPDADWPVTLLVVLLLWGMRRTGCRTTGRP